MVLDGELLVWVDGRPAPFQQMQRRLGRKRVGKKLLEECPVVFMHDKGELDFNGSIIVRNEGKGRFIYTGLVFFRELPAGVSGAFRLFANLISNPNLKPNTP